MATYSALFSPGRIGSREAKNRLVMAPMVRNYADREGRVTPRFLAHMERIARGGVGTMILEASYVTPEGKGFANQLGIHSDDLIPGLAELAQLAHAQGALIGPQLFHAGRQTSAAVTGTQPVAPSAVTCATVGEEPRALSVEEIQTIVDAFGQAARRAKEAGFDFVELHGAHGYLLMQFLSPLTNTRDDAYGGSREKRMRFLEEVVRATRDAVGAGFPIIVRLSGDELLPNGLKMEDTIAIARRLEELGVDALHISAGGYDSYNTGLMIQPMAIPDGPLIPYAQGVKQAVGIPVIAVGKLRSPELGDQLIRDGKADFVAIGRSLLADPEWPNKAREGRLKEITPCIACNQGCISRLFLQRDVWCTVNPVTARELEFSKPAPATKKRVLIAGGGPAGMEAAKVATERGHSVVLFEEDDHVGGQLIAATAAPFRPGWAELDNYLIDEMVRLGIDVRLNTKVTPDVVRQEKPDAVILATGSSAVTPDFPGVQLANVVIARDLLEGKATAKGRVVVAGGGCAGAQTAEYLAERGHPVVIVEMLDEIAVDAPRADRELLLERLRKRGVEFRVRTKNTEMKAGSVTVEDPQGTHEWPADTVVICLGSRANDELVRELQGVIGHVISAGDAVKPRQVTEAIAEGALAALSL
ncbi:MAG TPA: FAD-dependent oxidoreductase [Armatimonadota bacterium]|nr:FAD-dependent oxidoreductase [Armatimonadota bacterium]